MPFIRQRQDEEEKRLGQRPGSQVGMAGQAVAATPAQQGPQAPSSVPGSQHVNFIDYLKANEGAGKAMADRVAAPIEQKAGQIAGADVTKKQTLSATDFTPRAPEVKMPDGGNYADWLTSQGWDPAQAGQGGRAPTYSQALRPRAGAQTPLTGQAELDAAADVERQTKMLGTDGGQKELLDKAYGSGRTAGESAFDNALMSGEGKAKLDALKAKYAGLTQMVQGRQDYNWAQGEAARRAEDERRIAAAPKPGAASGGERVYTRADGSVITDPDEIRQAQEATLSPEEQEAYRGMTPEQQAQFLLGKFGGLVGRGGTKPLNELTGADIGKGAVKIGKAIPAWLSGPAGIFGMFNTGLK